MLHKSAKSPTPTVQLLHFQALVPANYNFNIFYMLLHIRLLLYLFHNIQLEWHCIA